MRLITRLAPVFFLTLAAAAIFFLPSLWVPQWNYSRWDNSEILIPSLNAIHSAWLNGEFPAVNFHQHLGETFEAGLQSGVFYFPHTFSLALLHALKLNLKYLNHIIAFIHLLWGMLGFYLAQRAMKVRPTLAAMTAICAFSGGFLSAITTVWFFILPVFAWLCWAFLGTLWILNRTHLRIAYMLLAVSLAAPFLLGAPQFMVYSWVFLALLSLLASRVIFKKFSEVFRLLPGWIGGVLLTLPAVLPCVLYLTETARKNKFSLNEFQEYNAHFSELFGLFTPFIRADNGYLTDKSSMPFYQGSQLGLLIILALVILFLKKIKEKANTVHSALLGSTQTNELLWLLPFLSVTLLFLLFSFGGSTFVYRLTYSLPVWSSFRWPYKFTLIVMWGLGMISGLLAEFLARQNGKYLKQGLALVGTVAIILLVLIIWRPSEQLNSVSSYLLIPGSVGLFFLTPFLHLKPARVLSLFCAFISGLGVITLSHTMGLRDLNEPFGKYGTQYFHIPKNSRVLPVSDSSSEQQPLGLFNSAAGNDYYSLTGCAHPFVSTRFFKLIHSGVYAVLPPSDLQELLPTHFFDSLGVRYLITPKNDQENLGFLNKEAQKEKFKKISVTPTAFVFENIHALEWLYFSPLVLPFTPEAFQNGLIKNEKPSSTVYVNVKNDFPFGFRPHAEVVSSEWTPGGKIRVQVNAPQGGFLVASALWLPGWRVKVDGLVQHSLEVNQLIQGVDLPPGANKVEFYYEVPGLKVGLLMAFTGFFFLLFVNPILERFYLWKQSRQ